MLDGMRSDSTRLYIVLEKDLHTSNIRTPLKRLNDVMVWDGAEDIAFDYTFASVTLQLCVDERHE